MSESGIKIYSVQALGRSHATSFWKELAKISSGYYLELNQFSDILNLILAVGHQQNSNDALMSYENELIVSYSGTDVNVGDLKPVSSGRFQVLDVDSDVAIKDFVLSNGVEFKIGRGFTNLQNESLFKIIKKSF